ncbi:23S rRNA (adenine(2030)-N(6))-methyltransferase RlmJ [Escherichia coli]
MEKADGYQQLKSKLPPAYLVRSLILIDPPYEIKSDYQAVVAGISRRLQTFCYRHLRTVVSRGAARADQAHD